MESFIGFVLRFNLDFLSVLIIRDEYRGVVEKCTLNRAASLLPRVLFYIELESYAKLDHFVNIHSDATLLCQSLQIICATWCINFHGYFPNAYEKLIFPKYI